MAATKSTPEGKTKLLLLLFYAVGAESSTHKGQGGGREGQGSTASRLPHCYSSSASSASSFAACPPPFQRTVMRVFRDFEICLSRAFSEGRTPRIWRMAVPGRPRFCSVGGGRGGKRRKGGGGRQTRSARKAPSAKGKQQQATRTSRVVRSLALATKAPSLQKVVKTCRSLLPSFTGTKAAA